MEVRSRPIQSFPALTMPHKNSKNQDKRLRSPSLLAEHENQSPSPPPERSAKRTRNQSASARQVEEERQEREARAESERLTKLDKRSAVAFKI
jgi:hypothetical protein